MEQGDDPYELLGVKVDDDDATIRKAYRKMALKWHPDKQRTEEDKAKATHQFAKISGAYEILSDPVLRKDYDEMQEEEDGCGFDGEATYEYDTAEYDVTPTEEAANTTTLAMPTERTGKTWFGGGKKKQQQQEQAKKKAAAAAKKKKRKPVNFNDPYEVFKKAFEDEFGVEYPGAKYDHVEGRDHYRAKGAPLALENGGDGDGKKKKKDDKKKKKKKDDSSSSSSSSSSSDSDSDSDDDKPKEKKKGIFGGLFGKKKDPKDETALVVKKDDRQLAKKEKKEKKKKKEENQLANVPQGLNEGNNRPVSMEEKTYTIDHPDGRVETITELKITRPDGSTETMRRTDMPDSNSGNWNKPKENMPKHKLLTGGEEKEEPKMLTDGGKKDQKMLTDGGGKKKDKGDAPKQITDGSEKKKSSGGIKTRKKLGGGGKDKDKQLALTNG